jgi:hypothetical protein
LVYCCCFQQQEIQALVCQHTAMLKKEVHNLEHTECMDQLFSASLFLPKVEDCKLLSNQAIHHIIQRLGTDVIHKH